LSLAHFALVERIDFIERRTNIMQAVADAITQPRRVDIAGAVDTVNTNTLGGRMAFARMRKSMTQKDLAERVKNKDGSSKSRATIVQYENDNIMPPLDVVELIAKQLGVSASYIAFGEHVVEGITNADVEMVSFPEITFGKDGEYISSTMAYSKERVAELGIARDAIKAYVMPHDAPAFDISAGDLLITDVSVTKPTNNGGLYIIKTQTGMEIIRVDPHYGSGARGKDLSFTDPSNRVMTAKMSELHFLGAVVSTVHDNRKK
jgi:transcriptional regulator with XRE-family HTH domain